MRKNLVTVIITACCLTACGSVTNPEHDNTSTQSETTATTTTTTESSRHKGITKIIEISEPEAETTSDEEWHRRDTYHSTIGLDTYVYAEPSEDSEQIGELKSGDVVVDIGDANVDNWIVIEWNDGIGFVNNFHRHMLNLEELELSSSFLFSRIFFYHYIKEPIIS